jgi:hypothetical protein
MTRGPAACGIGGRVARLLAARLLRSLLMALAAGAATIIVRRLLEPAPGEAARCPIHGLEYDREREACPAC